MAEYTMDDIFEPVVITIPEKKGNTVTEHRFRLRERTKALGEKADQFQRDFVGLPDDAPDEQAVELVIDFLDAMLEPLGDGNNGTRTHAKTILKKEYQADRWGSDKIIGLSNFCQRKQGERMDPQSAPRTDD